MSTRPISIIDGDSPLIDAVPGDPMPGHDDGHYVQSKEYVGDHGEIWLTVRCSCGQTFGGTFTSNQLKIASASELSRFATSSVPVLEFGKNSPQRHITVEERPSIAFDGPPLTGMCQRCGADLDALARAGKVGHACLGPDDVTNHDPAN